MKESKRDVENAILTLADYTELRGKYEKIIDESDATLPKIIEMVAYDLVLNEIYPPHIADDKVYDAHKVVVKYMNELRNKGFVDFNENRHSCHTMSTIS